MGEARRTNSAGPSPLVAEAALSVAAAASVATAGTAAASSAKAGPAAARRDSMATAAEEPENIKTEVEPVVVDPEAGDGAMTSDKKIQC